MAKIGIFSFPRSCVGMHIGLTVMGRSRYKITNPALPHFVTLTVLHWIPVFTRPDTVEIILDILRYLIKDGLKVYAYVILENHLHLVLQRPNLDKDIVRLKSYSVKQLISYLVI